ncbi:oxidoreductase [Hypoxylon sp. FL1857]|nr:oxidoreductase [Hypoxylon sp. FL1857]
MSTCVAKVEFNPEADISNLQGRVLFVTGAKHKRAHLYFTGQNQKSADTLISDISAIDASVGVIFLQCGFGSRASLVKAAEKFHSDRLDVFIACAGLMVVPADVTVDGYEIKFGMSHMGNFTLMRLLLPIMFRTAETPGSDVRFIALTSLGYGLRPHGSIIFESTKLKQENRNTWVKYGQSKLTSILTAKGMARRYPSITSVVVHPGTAKTGIVDGLSC